MAKLVDADGFRSYIRDGWGAWDNPISLPPGAKEAAAAHRARLAEQFPGQRIALAAGRAHVRSNDTFHEFRADSDFVWLTGCQVEGAVVVVENGDATLFVPTPSEPHTVDFFGDADRSPFWIGAAAGTREWSEALGITTKPIDDLPNALKGRHPETLTAKGVDPLLDALTGSHSDELRTALSELRRIKDDWEIGQLRNAVDATVKGFLDVAAELGQAVRGGGERWLQGTFDRRARTEGNGPGYTSIVASGPHAPVLHWTRCDGQINDADLLLLDAGVETKTLYTADVTRTFPVGGEFTEPQRQVYDLVLRSHVAALAEVKPGNDYSAFHHTAMRVLAEGLHDWGLLPVSVDKALDPSGQHHRRYIVCGTGHFLGLDVHDCADARQETYQQGILERGMALTVEPGLYFHPNDETLPPELRGIGVRLEDDLVVTSDGADILSDALPIDADEIAAWVRKNRS
ncbi:Xaa-Pro aminopeptidase [Lentzea guizhouensis]|uniref:Xaa-Pro aminopeptidase n=1 Tax=Lentzea guizhouensis TaxID=1586287 RepID=A0A1B2HQG7_9PSEU|nr:aminopeptidase P family protein [Lentzea guizhouensis]ANZ39974.1 Xaa-Pro aminopeptidase [Lentzea guizhouensis]